MIAQLEQQSAPVNIYHSELNNTGVTPTGYRILVEIPKKSEKVGSIYLADTTRKKEEIASLCARVLQLGPLCYQDKDKFGDTPSPWCVPGEHILMQAYSGTRLKVPGHELELRLINDDNVEAVVAGPDAIERAS